MKKNPKSQAVLAGFSASGALVFEEVLDLSNYWDELHPVIDEDGFRQERGVRRLVGKLYGLQGQLLEEFENTYDERGVLLTSNGRHEDGTVTKFPP